MGIRILVIEDDAEIADFLVRGLREEGFSVVRAADGPDGRHRLQSEAWDIVLLDWWLPQIDGLALFANFANEGTRRRSCYLQRAMPLPIESAV